MKQLLRSFGRSIIQTLEKLDELGDRLEDDLMKWREFVAAEKLVQPFLSRNGFERAKWDGIELICYYVNHDKGFHSDNKSFDHNMLMEWRRIENKLITECDPTEFLV